MNHRVDRLRLTSGGRPAAGWRFGFDEPGLGGGSHGFPARGEGPSKAAARRDDAYRARSPRGEDTPTTLAGRAVSWLIMSDGIIVVLVLGLVATAVVGGLVAGR